jgi:hypothetical protein
LNSVSMLPLEPLCQLFFVVGIFEIGSCELCAPAGFEPLILLIVFSVARITGVSEPLVPGYY